MPAAEKMDTPKKAGRTTTKQVGRQLPADVKLNTWQQAATLTERLTALR